jgi:hypothetical protein
MARGARLSGVAFRVISADRALLALVAWAVLVDLIIAGAFLAVASVAAGDLHRRVVLLAAVAAASYPITVVGTFVNVALLNTVSRRWNGETATIRDGLAVARGRWAAILAWSVVAATIGAVLSIAERVNHLAFIERLVAVLLDIAWGAAAFFVIPALAADGVGPREAFKRSVRTVRTRWAEAATGTVAIGGASAVALLPGILICMAGYALYRTQRDSAVVLLAIGVAAVVPVLVYSSATSAVFTLAVYRYAQDADSTGPFPESDLANPFIDGSARIRRARARARARARLGRRLKKSR